MSDPDLFLICPVCGMKMEISYGENQQRPTALDEGVVLYKCPVCSSHLIRIINPTFNERWNIENEVQYTAAQINKLLGMTEAFNETNSAKLKELAKQKEAQT